MIKTTERRASNPPYISKDLAIIIPTKDRPNEIRRLLQSITEMDCEIGRIIVVASGQEINEVVMAFARRLPVEYHRSDHGQIKQRNVGIAQLDETTRLVATMDDDAVFCRDAVSKMIVFWNCVEPETAGVGFNVINQKGHHHTWLRGFFGVSVPEPGRVLKSGIGTAITNVKESIRSEWLNGGATVWQQEILKTHPHRELRSRWAVCEDLIFSYPLGRKHPLYVCHDAQVEIEDVAMQNETPELYRFRGKSHSLWGLYFVFNNKELSIHSYFRYKIMHLLLVTVQGLIFLDYRKIQWSIGIIMAVYLSLYLLLKKNNIVNLIESNT